MIYVLSVIGIVPLGISIYLLVDNVITNKRLNKQIKHNSYHLTRANELFEAYLETGDQDYLKYCDEELNKVQY